MCSPISRSPGIWRGGGASAMACGRTSRSHALRHTATAFLVTLVLTALLAAACFAVSLKGYPHGATGIARLDSIANAATFIPLAALYAFAGLLIVLSPARAAGFLYANAASPVHFASVVLLASITGLQATRFAFGDSGPWRPLIDWQFVFAAGIIIAHQLLDALRRNILLRTLGFVVFLVAALACLFWDFRF